MTSRKALELIENRLITIHENNKIGSRKFLEVDNDRCVKVSLYHLPQIKKDLDLLEVLKKLKPMIKVYQYIEFDNWVLEIGELKISLDEKEKEILQEWLEND